MCTPSSSLSCSEPPTNSGRCSSTGEVALRATLASRSQPTQRPFTSSIGRMLRMVTPCLGSASVPCAGSAEPVRSRHSHVLINQLDSKIMFLFSVPLGQDQHSDVCRTSALSSICLVCLGTPFAEAVPRRCSAVGAQWLRSSQPAVGAPQLCCATCALATSTGEQLLKLPISPLTPTDVSVSWQLSRHRSLVIEINQSPSDPPLSSSSGSSAASFPPFPPQFRRNRRRTSPLLLSPFCAHPSSPLELPPSSRAPVYQSVLLRAFFPLASHLVLPITCLLCALAVPLARLAALSAHESCA